MRLIMCFVLQYRPDGFTETLNVFDLSSYEGELNNASHINY